MLDFTLVHKKPILGGCVCSLRNIHDALMGLSDQRFDELKNGRYELTYGHEVLDKIAKPLAQAQIDNVAVERESRRKADLAEEEKLKEEKLRAEELAQKEAEDKQMFPCQIIKKSAFLDYKLSLDIQLQGKNGALPTKDQLETIANTLYRQFDGKKYERVFICYYLPGMVVDSGAWAITHFNPKLEVKILGDIQVKSPPSALSLSKSLKAGAQYKIIGEITLMPVHPDDLSGDISNQLAKMKKITTGPSGVLVFIHKVRMNGKTPWYFAELSGIKGWINSISLRQAKIQEK